MFDVAMGCYDGAEVCELVGLYILHKLTSTYTNGSIGLYRDDGLAVFKNMSARSLDKARKDFSKILGELGLQITAQSNLKIVNYLDVTLNLTTAKYYPIENQITTRSTLTRNPTTLLPSSNTFQLP